MKKYMTWEAIKMLGENNSAEFKDADGSILKLSSGGYLYRKHMEKPEHVSLNDIDYNIKPNTEWTLVEQPVTFTEAVKAYSEGKTIRCEYCEATSYFKNGYGYCQFKDTELRAPCPNRILEGKWYIEETP